MSEINATIIDRAGLSGSADYQQRVPKVHSFMKFDESGEPVRDVNGNALGVKDGIAAVQSTLNQYPALLNEFQSGLINLIGSQRYKTLTWENPLAELKTADFADGKTVQEIAVQMIKSEEYNPKANNFLERYDVPVKSAFFSVNRAVFYAITLNPRKLVQSFTAPGGVVGFVDAAIASAVNSAKYDEYQYMMKAFAGANAEHPFYNVNVNIADTSSPTGDELRRLSAEIRTVAEDMTFPSTQYTGFGVEANTPKDRLVLLVTPRIKANLEVQVLADAFNTSYAEIQQRIITVKELPWAGAHAVLLDRQAVVAGDSVYEWRMFPNPRSLEDTYYLHHHGGYAVSPLSNIAVFSNSPSTNIGVVNVAFEDIDAKIVDTHSNEREALTVVPGTNRLRLKVEGIGDISGDGKLNRFRIPSEYTAFAYVDGGDKEGMVDTTGLFVDSRGYLHVSDSFEPGQEITIVVKSSYLNPSAPIGAPADYRSKEIVVTVADRVEYSEESEEPETPED